MKLRHLLIGMLALAATVSCKQDEPVEVPELKVSKTEINLAAEAGESSFELTTNQDWTATPDADWVSVNPASGKGTGTAVAIKVTADDNAATEARTANVKVKAGALTKTIKVIQAAKGEEPGTDTPVDPEAKPTIKAFAQEYVKIIKVYEETVGTVNYLSKNGVVDPTVTYDQPSIENVHYVPLTTSITVAGKSYTTAQIFDIAIRSYLVLRGYDATDETAVGAGAFKTLAKAYTMDDAYLAPRDVVWGDYPYNESGTTDAAGATTGNGGPLKMGTPPTGVDKVKVDLLDNFAERNCNFATVKNSGAIGNLASYSKRIDGYFGCASSMRMLLTYAYFFQYMLENNLSDATQIPAEQTFNSFHFELSSDEPSTPGEPETPAGFEAGNYWIMATKDNATKVMTSLGDKNYGYATSEDAVEGKSYAKNTFTFRAVEGGFTIKDANGKFYYQEKGTTYKTFNVGVDSTLAGCVWTVTPQADGTYAIVNKESEKTIRYGEGTYTSFGVYGASEGEGSVLVNLVKADSPIADPTPEQPEEPEQPAPEVPWTLGDASYTQKATINGTADVPVLKLGKSEAVGTATIKIPAGTTTATFSAVAWKNKSTKLTFAAEGIGTIHEVTLKGNDGATGSEPYTITTDGSEVQNINVYALVANINNGTPAPLPVELAVTVTTDATNYRAILWGFEFGTDVPEAPAPAGPTIKDFATEYVKLIDVWQTTTGTVNYLKGVGEAGDEFDMFNAHYIPEDTKVKVGDKEYTLPDALELAERSYLLVRGWDGNNTTAGKGTFPTIEGTSMDTQLPETHEYIWGENPYNETGKTEVGNKVSGNGGGFRMGDPNVLDGVEAVKLDVLDNFAQRHLNWPLTHNKAISNICGYSTGQLAGYYGCFSAKRALLTYAYFFKYMIDNNLADAKTIAADQTFSTYLFGPDATNQKPGEEPAIQDGTEANPYLIASAEDMVAMKEKTVVGQTTYFKMTADVDMAAVTTWATINAVGDEKFGRAVHFDGDNHTISNFGPTTYEGSYPSIFGILNGTVKNVKFTNVNIVGSGGPSAVLGGYVGNASQKFGAIVENVHIQGTISTNGDLTRVGAFGGVLYNTTYKDCTADVTMTSQREDFGAFGGQSTGNLVMQNCKAKVNITNNRPDNSMRTGALVGYINQSSTSALIENCSAEGTIKEGVTSTKSHSAFLGGFFGWAGVAEGGKLVIKNSHSTVSIEASEFSNNVGGFIGNIGQGEVEFNNCSAQGTIIGGQQTGGIAGLMEASFGTYTNVTAKVTLNCTAKNYVGGMLGRMSTADKLVTFTNCHYEGNIDAGSSVGGIIGAPAAGVDLYNCSAKGNIVGKANVGGLAGQTATTGVIKNCSYVGDITSNGATGGLVGNCYSTLVENCFVNSNIVNAGNIAGGLLGTVHTATTSLEIKNSYATGSIQGVCGVGGIVGNLGLSTTAKMSGVFSWSESIKSAKTNPTNYSSGAIIANIGNSTYKYPECYIAAVRNPNLVFSDYSGNYPDATDGPETMTNELKDHDDIVKDNLPASLVPQEKGYANDWAQRPYHGKAAAADATPCGIATAYGWDTSVWNLSGALPVLK